MIAATGLPADAETLFRAVAAAADALWVADAAGRIAFLNPAALKILGYDNAAELLGRPSHETIHYMRPDGSLFPAAECPMLAPRRTGETILWSCHAAGSSLPCGRWHGIRDRADAGGHLTLASPVGGPTIVTAELPIHGDHADSR